MLIIGFQGCEINEHSPISQWLSNDGVGGVLLFDKELDTGSYGKNLKSQAKIKQLTHQLNHYSANDLSDSALEEEFGQMASTLQSLGFNLNFAPVVDLDLNNQEGIIGKLKRSFSSDPAQIVRVARQFVDVFSRHGIACAYKHFPGHGSAVGDTHEGFVDVTNTFKPEELVPYQRLLQDVYKPTMVMTAHVINKHLDSKGLPATLSHEVLTGMLRREMGYDGVIISDDLQMHAISNHYSLEESLCLTINAGADMMIFANQLGSITAPEVIDCVEQLVLHRKIDPQRIDDAYRRIMRLKQQISCIELA